MDYLQMSGEGKLISLYLFPMAQMHLSVYLQLLHHTSNSYVLFANFEHVPWYDPSHVENRRSQGATVPLGALKC